MKNLKQLLMKKKSTKKWKKTLEWWKLVINYVKKNLKTSDKISKMGRIKKKKFNK